MSEANAAFALAFAERVADKPLAEKRPVRVASPIGEGEGKRNVRGACRRQAIARAGIASPVGDASRTLHFITLAMTVNIFVHLLTIFNNKYSVRLN